MQLSKVSFCLQANLNKLSTWGKHNETLTFAASGLKRHSCVYFFFFGVAFQDMVPLHYSDRLRTPIVKTPIVKSHR